MLEAMPKIPDYEAAVLYDPLLKVLVYESEIVSAR